MKRSFMRTPGFRRSVISIFQLTNCLSGASRTDSGSPMSTSLWDGAMNKQHLPPPLSPAIPPCHHLLAQWSLTFCNIEKNNQCQILEFKIIQFDCYFDRHESSDYGQEMEIWTKKWQWQFVKSKRPGRFQFASRVKSQTGQLWLWTIIWQTSFRLELAPFVKILNQKQPGQRGYVHSSQLRMTEQQSFPLERT
jgi:hypothetical protein